MRKLDRETMQRYELYVELREEFEKIYRYRWPVSVWNGEQQWREGTDALNTMCWKQKESWIERPEIIEEVEE